MTWLQRVGIIGFVLWMFSAVSNPVEAQLSMDVEVDDNLSNAQSINVQSLIANNGKGPTLFRMYLQNNSSEYKNDLYFRIIVESDNIGRIADIKQVSGQPFSLSPGQQVFATNNNIGDGLPGVEEAIQFSGDFTTEGEEFVNKLQGSTTLPADEYQVTIEIYRGSVGGTPVISESAEIGANIVEDSRDFYLLSPGDVVGSDATISSSYPSFQWQGETGASYRLIVVEAKSNESAQSLMDGAQSTTPIQSNGSASGGSLLDYEMMDVVINQSSFQYPNSGVQSLEPGKKYYWRIVNELETSGGVDARESEIWNFTLLDTQNSGDNRENGEMTRTLRELLGDRLQNITQEGYSFESISIDGQIFQDVQALQKLMELGQKAQQGDISIVIEEQ